MNHVGHSNNCQLSIVNSENNCQLSTVHCQLKKLPFSNVLSFNFPLYEKEKLL